MDDVLGEALVVDEVAWPSLYNSASFQRSARRRRLADDRPAGPCRWSIERCRHVSVP
jgi:hypothetical protein